MKKKGFELSNSSTFSLSSREFSRVKKELLKFHETVEKKLIEQIGELDNETVASTLMDAMVC